uniref:Uncharacterized protein n=1 Tax=Anguilla anguilla TaxID=7936 RepID=A0A0E9U2B6_ANGAN
MSFVYKWQAMKSRPN